MLGVIHREVDVLVAHTARAVEGKQETLVEIGVEVGLLGRCALVQLEGEYKGDVYLVFKTLSHQIVIQVVDAGLVVVAQFVDRYGCHFACHTLNKGLGQDNGFAFLGLLHVGVGRFEFLLGNTVGGSNRCKSLAALHLILVVASSRTLIDEGQGSVGHDLDGSAVGILVGL